MKRRDWLLLAPMCAALAAATACADGAGGPSSRPDAHLDPAASVPAGVDLEFVADYSRYLWHTRRLVVQTTNHGDTPVEVTHVALRTGHFTPLDAEAKSTTIAPGARVDVQVDFGEVISCTDEPVGSTEVLVELGAPSLDRPTSFLAELDPRPLDDIRNRECARRQVTDAASIAFGPTTIVDTDDPTAPSPTTMQTTLEIDRRAGTDPVVITSVQGSVIIALHAPDSGEPVARLGADDQHVSTPVELFIARCEPHAVSQSTLTWVLSAFVSVDGATPHKLPIDIDAAMHAELQAMIDDCIARLAAEQ
ncbi:MAG: hypothetical protein WBP59_05000 [Ilumatobacteraceae bacterium]